MKKSTDQTEKLNFAQSNAIKAWDEVLLSTSKIEMEVIIVCVIYNEDDKGDFKKLSGADSEKE